MRNPEPKAKRFNVVRLEDYGKGIMSKGTFTYGSGFFGPADIVGDSLCIAVLLPFPSIILAEIFGGGALLCFPVCWVAACIYAYEGFRQKAEWERKKTEQARKWESGSAERARKEVRERIERARILREQTMNEAYTKEEDLDYTGALRIWESLGDRNEARRIRLKMREEGRTKVDQTVVQGDYVDDRDTIVKDSVLNRSNVGAGGKTKGERIKLIKELLDSGAIDKDDYEKMKREIIG